MPGKDVPFPAGEAKPLSPPLLPSFSLYYVLLFFFCRAINNGLLDTYQLKSLDGLLEGDLEDLAIVKDKKGKLHITLRFYLENRNTSAGIDSITLPQDELDNFATRAPYDRVIRCLGWKFDFSIYNR